MSWQRSLRRGCAAAARNWLAPVVAPVGRRLPVRVLAPMLQAIGHESAEPECYVREELLARQSRRLALLLASRAEPVANACLLEYWKRYFWIVREPLLCAVLAPLARVAGLWHDVHDYVIAFNRTARAYAIQAACRDAPPLLRLKRNHRREGESNLQRPGLPSDAWYVCVHCRAEGYWSEETHQNYRNAAIETYLPAIREITARGGWCFRMGDDTMPRLPAMERVIDYAHHPLRSDRMDVFLSATCRFFIGSASGLSMVPNLFGVRSAITNLTPFSAALPFGPCDIGIPKLVSSNADRRYLSFPELLDSPLGNARFTHCYDRAGVTLVDNSPDEILDLTTEMLDLADGKQVYDRSDDDLQQRFRALFRPGHYCHGSAARIGRDFLRKHVSLLEAPCERGEICYWPDDACDARMAGCYCRMQHETARHRAG